MLNEIVGNLSDIISTLYNSTCTIVEYKSIKDPITKRTTHKEIIQFESEPCRLSYKTIKSSTDGVTSNLTQIVKLIISPDVNINPGSKIIVTNNGKITEYKNSGVPATYSNHQEIMLELFDGWA
ncbi:MAG: hypothetical protein J6D47_11985 [Peptostreptococcaceae bacterium]|nr:hypothetical protein [Peptostreptococcaceae bacterium]